MRVLVISHSSLLTHPGGAESAAINQVAVLRSHGHEVVHLACRPEMERAFGYDDSSGTYLIRSSTRGNDFHWTEPTTSALWRNRIQAIQPEVVHLHHYQNIGVMLPAMIKQMLPNCRVILTLHEYLAICGRDGQMVDSAGSLCQSSGIQKCASCLNLRPGAVAINRNLIHNSLYFVDYLVCPSEFLLSRYEEAGFDKQKLVRLGNFISVPSFSRNRELLQPRSDLTRFVFASQHTPWKGLEVLLRAIHRLAMTEENFIQRFSFTIWGSGSERWPDFQERLSELREKVSPWTSFRGRYDSSMLSAIYEDADFLVLPSTWWENAPVTIFESLNHGVPVIGSDLGGIREALLKEPSSILFRPNCELSLSEALLRASEEMDQKRQIMWNGSRSNEMNYQHLVNLYNQT